MTDDFDDRMRSMLAGRARSASVEPDLQRVVADASRRSPRASVERLAFLAAVAALLALIVSLGVVLGSRTSDDLAGLEPGAGQSGAPQGASEPPATFETSTTVVETTGPVTTQPISGDCVVITTEGAGGSMVEVLDCPTTEPGPGASVDCSPGEVANSRPPTTACPGPVVTYTCDPATWPEGVTSNTDPRCTSSTETTDGEGTVLPETSGDPTGSLPLCDITTIPGDQCIPNDSLVPTPPPTATHDTSCPQGGAPTTAACLSEPPSTPTSGPTGSSAATPTPPTTAP